MINFQTPITGQDGEVVKQNFKISKLVKGKLTETNEYREVILEDLARNALLKDQDGQENNQDEILTRYRLFRKIYKQGEVKLTAEEKTLLKRLICSNYEVLFAGQALELIN